MPGRTRAFPRGRFPRQHPARACGGDRQRPCSHDGGVATRLGRKMSDVIVFPAGGYRYLKAVFQFSSGVAAEPGFAIERVRLTRPLPLADGFAAAEAYLKSI